MIKMGNRKLEWVFLHAKNGEQFAGLVDVPDDLKDDDKLYKRCLAAELLQPKVDFGTTPTERHHGVSREVDRIIELMSPVQVIIQAGQGKQVIACIGMDYGDKAIFVRAGDFMYAQFLDDKSPIVIQIKSANSSIVRPGEPGEATTPSGLVIPGAGAPR